MGQNITWAWPLTLLGTGVLLVVLGLACVGVVHVVSRLLGRR